MYITLGVSLAGPYSSPIPPLKATGGSLPPLVLSYKELT